MLHKAPIQRGLGRDPIQRKLPKAPSEFEGLHISARIEGALTLSTLSSTDRSFQPAPSGTIVLFVVTALLCQVGL